MQQLVADVKAGLIDIVVVYKIDRLSRSLIDFASLFGRFETHKTDFVAVTQPINTTSSVGRLTLNILLSFAQFERELLSERLRDKAAAAREKGLWHAGGRPFGYRLDKGKLIVDAEEAETVRFAFKRYPSVGAARLLAEQMSAEGMLNKAGRSFTTSNLLKLLNNRLYRGDLVHYGRVIPGAHAPLITEAEWNRARRALQKASSTHRPAMRPFVTNPLKGRIFGPDGGMISHDFVYNRQGRIYRYYLPSGRSQRRAFDHPNTRFRADALEDAILIAIMNYVPFLQRGTARENRSKLLKALINRVDIGQEEIDITLRSGAFLKMPLSGKVRTKSLRKPRGKHPIHKSTSSDAVAEGDQKL